MIYLVHISFISAKTDPGSLRMAQIPNRLDEAVGTVAALCGGKPVWTADARRVRRPLDTIAAAHS